jgi:hypothetical protein
MAKTITSANSIITLSIPDLIPAPFQLQGFAADNVFESESIDQVQTVMGVDGNLSAGVVLVEVPMTIHLQADSDSIQYFETWLATQRQQLEVFYANGQVVLPSVKKTFTMTKGVLKRGPWMPSAGKTLQPQVYNLVWQTIQPAVL